jgi:hypothetical protein
MPCRWIAARGVFLLLFLSQQTMCWRYLPVAALACSAMVRRGERAFYRTWCMTQL